MKTPSRNRDEFRRRIRRAIRFGLCLGLTTVCLRAEEITRWTVDGGGGTMRGGRFSLQGTVGQTDAGSMMGGDFALHGGFWSGVQLVQTPGFPLLHVARDGEDAILWWEDPEDAFQLQESSTMESATWATVVQAPFHVEGVKQIVVEPDSKSRFFRLRRK